jgi:hypothetical protein
VRPSCRRGCTAPATHAARPQPSLGKGERRGGKRRKEVKLLKPLYFKKKVKISTRKTKKIVNKKKVKIPTRKIKKIMNKKKVKTIKKLKQ